MSVSAERKRADRRVMFAVLGVLGFLGLVGAVQFYRLLHQGPCGPYHAWDLSPVDRAHRCLLPARFMVCASIDTHKGDVQCSVDSKSSEMYFSDEGHVFGRPCTAEERASVDFDHLAACP